jgi:hypothetical protein
MDSIQHEKSRHVVALFHPLGQVLGSGDNHGVDPMISAVHNCPSPIMMAATSVASVCSSRFVSGGILLNR